MQVNFPLNVSVFTTDKNGLCKVVRTDIIILSDILYYHADLMVDI